MLDLYLIITPCFGIVTLLTVLNLKLTLNQPRPQNLKNYEKKKPEITDPQIEPALVKQEVKDQALEPGFKKTFFYLLKNFTPAEMFCVRRSRNKIPVLFSISVIALLSITINLPFVFCFIGTVITLSFVCGKMLTQKQEESNYDIQSGIPRQNAKEQEKFQQKLQIIFTSLALIVQLLVIGISFKNYRNAFLSSAVQNFVFTVLLDNFLVKPLALTVFAYFVKNVAFVDNYIDKEIQIVEILLEERLLKKQTVVPISALSPKKMKSSPSKVPKAKNVEPRIDPELSQNLINTLDLTKNLRKPKLSPICLKKRNEHAEGDCSLISILNSHQKKKNQNANSSFDFDKSLFEQKEEKAQQQPQQPIPDVQISSKPNQEEKKENQEAQNCMKSIKLIMVSQNNSIVNNFLNDDIENQEDNDENREKSIKESQLKTITRNDCLRFSLHKSIEDQENQENLDNYFEEEYNTYQQRPHSTLEEDNSILGYGTGPNTGRRNGLLKINQDRKAEDLQEIDLNSPQRRKQQPSKIVEEAEKPKKKKKVPPKKYSLDPNRHVIKHSTGEPYLEFLPNLLAKEREQKKRKSLHQGSQQGFSRKLDVMNVYSNESRLAKSVKRPKQNKDLFVRENDENKVPEFMMDDFN